MFCTKCGKQNLDDVKFCSACGAQLGEAAVQQTPTTTAIRYETVALTVHPDNEQGTIDEYEAFGWEVLSSQTIDSSVSHEESRWDGNWSVVERRNYVKLSFRRDKNIPHRDELNALHKKYQENEPVFTSSPVKKYVIIGIVGALILGFIPVIGSLLAIAFVVALVMYSKKQIAEENSSAGNLNNERNKVRRECLERAKELLG